MGSPRFFAQAYLINQSILNKLQNETVLNRTETVRRPQKWAVCGVYSQ